jgi:hypothetical protein
MKTVAALSLLIGGVAAVFVLAQDSSAPPSPDREHRPGAARPDGPMGRGMMGRGSAGGAGRAPGSAPSPEEWAEISQFMREHSPLRWEQYEKLGPEAQKRLETVIIERYRTLQRLKQDSPEIYEIRMKRLPLEDRIFRLSREVRRAKGNSDKAAPLRQELTMAVARWIKLGFDEQEARIKQLQDQVDRMTARLKNEQAQSEELIKNRVEMVEKTGNLGPDLDRRTDGQPERRFAAPKDARDARDASRPGPSTSPDR